MVIEILSFKTSILNSLLKIVVPLMFAIGTYYFYQAERKYGGNLQIIARFLMFGGIAGFIATAFRYAGDFAYQWKWGESTLFLIFAVINLVVAYVVYSKFMEIIRAFGLLGDEG